MKKYKIAFIGTGGRSVCYARVYNTCDEIEIVAVADPNSEHRRTMAARAGLECDFRTYDDWREMLRSHPDLDGVVICTPNYMHAEQAVACLERGMSVALEKPLATTHEDCEKIIRAERTSGKKVLLGFVLRSTPFYSKIFDLISGGDIGEIISIQADELPGLGVTSINCRSEWRRKSELSGGLMLEKCCHDMDVFNWIIKSRPVSLASYGATKIFQPDKTLPERCDECHNGEQSCQYYKRQKFSSHEDSGEKTLYEFIREDDRCIYNIDKNIVDVQSVCIEYENGVLVNFMLNLNCMGPQAGRNFHAVGSKGMIWGNLADEKVFLYKNTEDAVTSFQTRGDGSGHGGGDRRHAMLLLEMMKDPTYVPEQNVYAGYLSAAMCFASEISMKRKSKISFRYTPEGLVILE